MTDVDVNEADRAARREVIENWIALAAVMASHLGSEARDADQLRREADALDPGDRKVLH
jgi:hypothetical protein